MIKIITVIFAIGIMGLLILGLVKSENKNREADISQVQLSDDVKKQENINMEDTKIVTFNTSAGSFKLEIYTGKVPKTAGNFIKLASEGFYDGTRFHRVIEDFMLQGGDPLSKDESKRAMWGTGDPGYKFDDEFGEGLSNITGSISMANSGPNTNGSQFFINVKDNTFLDFDKEPLISKHSVFGKVIEGMDIVLEISKVATGPGDQPLEDVIVESVIVE